MRDYYTNNKKGFIYLVLSQNCIWHVSRFNQHYQIETKHNNLSLLNFDIFLDWRFKRLKANHFLFNTYFHPDMLDMLDHLFRNRKSK